MLKPQIKHLPNTLTLCRLAGAVLLIFMPAMGRGFLCVYLLCGITDVLDGRLARRLGCESRLGAALDGLADAAFTAISLFKLLTHFGLPAWVWAWCGGIAAVKLISLACNYKRFGRAEFLSNRANKIAGVAFYISPIFLLRFNACAVAAAVEVIASCAAVYECVRINKDGKNQDNNN